jgi:hypothetical protein
MTRLTTAQINLVIVFTILTAWCQAAASEYRDQVLFNGAPLPGATITARRGAKTLHTLSDQGGMYSFADLSDGAWKIEIKMQCFASLASDVQISASMPAARWEMKLVAADQITAHAETAGTATNAAGTPQANKVKKPEEETAAPAPSKSAESSDANQQSADGFLINGSVNNAATSQYELSHAFGNHRPGSKSLYTGGLSAIIGNSALDARPYSLSGRATPKDIYDRVTMALTLGGPIKIPHLLPHGPESFVSYQWTRNSLAAIEPGIVPTTQERAGNLTELLNTSGQPVSLYDPVTGVPISDNLVPVPQAVALLRFYPQPNITGVSSYNYQTQVLNSSHQDVLQTRLDKSLGRKEELYGGLNLQSTRAGSTNIFGFVDATNTLGIDSNINWVHRINSRIYGQLGYRFSRLRTQVVPSFANRTDIEGAASITGYDHSAVDWGPPALNFSSGIAPLSDAESAFNRNRTDAISAAAQIFHRRHNITAGADLRKQQYNDFFQQDPRGTFTFTGAATASTAITGSGSDLADFLLGVPDTSSIAFGNADKYLRQTVYDAFFTDDWRILPVLTINAGMRWEYGAPMTELHGRLVNLDLTDNFAAESPVLGSDPVGAITGSHYPHSLIRPDKHEIEPRVGLSWRPIPASTIVVRAGYGLYQDTSVYLNSTLQMAQQAPLSKSLSATNSAACQLSMSNVLEGLNPCAALTTDNFAMDPNFRIGYAQSWQLSVQRDLPAAMQLTVTYFGVKGTHGVQEFLPNTYPIGGATPCPSCPSGFAYRTSGGNSIRESGMAQLRRRLRNGFSASLQYTYAKSLDDDAYLGGQGHVTASPSGQTATTSSAGADASIAQNWLSPRTERSLSSFDQRHLLNPQAQYTCGEGLHGGDLMSGWRGRVLKEWTVITGITAGSGLPETPIYFATVPGAAFTGTIRPTLTGASIYNASAGLHLNSAAYTAPFSGQWGNAGRNSVTGPMQFTLDSSLARTFRPTQRLSLDARVDATNLLNHAVFTGWNATINSTQNGKFRRVKIGLAPPTEASLSYREGYYAEKEFSHFNEVDKERQLEDALMLGDRSDGFHGNRFLSTQSRRIFCSHHGQDSWPRTGSGQAWRGTTPFNFNLDLHELPPGEYTCQVTVLDSSTSKATFWRAPILLVAE